MELSGQQHFPTT